MPKNMLALASKEVLNAAANEQLAHASAKNQRYLGVLMKNNLTWSLNCNTQLIKAWRAFYFLKRNISKIASWKTKLNTYAGYVVSVVAYASQVCYASKRDMKAREKRRRK